MNRLRSTQVLLTALLAGAGWSILHASPITGLDLSAADGYNVFTYGSDSLANSDIEGRLAAGGSVNLSSYSVGANVAAANPALPSIVVAGSLSATNGSVYGSVDVGGAYASSSFTVQSGATTRSNLGTNLPVNFASSEQTLTADSALYGSQSTNGSISFAYGTLTLTGVGTGPVDIFDIAASELASTYTLNLDVASGTQVLINISGASASVSNLGINLNDGVTDNDVLFNFYQATSLYISGVSLPGSILAPNAAVNFSNGAVNGQLIADTLSGGGQVNLVEFNNCLTVPKASVPDSGNTAALLAVALVAGAGLLRRRAVAGASAL